MLTLIAQAVICNIYPIVSKHLYSTSRSAHQSEALPLTQIGSTDAVVLQSNCVQRTCSRYLHSNCLRRGSNPYSPHYRPIALTNRQLCLCLHCVLPFLLLLNQNCPFL